MKIGTQKTIDRSAGWFLLLAVFFGLGLFVGSRDILPRIGESLTTWAQRVRSFQSGQDPPTLNVDMRFQNYTSLLQLRGEAIESGVYIPSNQDFVTATIQLDNSLVPISMRPYPGLADHLQETDRWNLDVRTRRNQLLLGMQRFYLLASPDNNQLHQWAFSRALAREGILTTRYQFVNLVFNGDSWGTYALQEGFGDELMTANGRQAGVILEFDTDLLWKSIIRFGSVQAAQDDPVTNLLATDFAYFEIDTFREATVASDEIRSAQKDAGIGRLRALQAGQASASEIFDTEKYGLFLALVDLWGANEAVELVNLRYYYDPDTDLLEPIGSGSTLLGDTERLPLTAAYNDPILQASYAREAQRLSQPAYLTELRSELEKELQTVQHGTNTTVGDLSSLWTTLAERQEQIRCSLDPVQPLFANLGPPAAHTSAFIRIDIANVINLPLEILGFDIQGLTFLEADPAWLQTEAKADLLTIVDNRIILHAASSSPIHYVSFGLPIVEIIRRDQEIEFLQPSDIYVATRILGLDSSQLTLVREEALE